MARRADDVTELRELLALTSSLAGDFLESLDDRHVLLPVDVDELRRSLGGPLADRERDVDRTLAAFSAAVG